MLHPAGTGDDDDDDEEPSWLTSAPSLLGMVDDAEAGTVVDDEEPDWLAQAHEDAFTGEALLETLRLLDQETDALSETLSHAPPPPADEDEEPEWLSRAAKHIIDIEPLWDETAALAQGGLLTATEEAAGASSSADAGALRWLDAQLLQLVATSFPHLERLVSSPSLMSAERDTLAHELLRKRDVLMLRERQSSANVALPVAVRTMSMELRREEASLHKTRRAAAKQNRGYAALYQQLEFTRSAAAATSGAARTIVDDHEKDVNVLLAELKRYSPPEAYLTAEKKLSASLHQLQARKRRAQAEAKAGKMAGKRAENGAAAAGSVGNTRARVLSFGRRPNRSKVEAPAAESPSPDDGGGVSAPAAVEKRASAASGVGRAVRALSFTKKGERPARAAERSARPDDEFIVIERDA